jgi:outer membrane protein
VQKSLPLVSLAVLSLALPVMGSVPAAHSHQEAHQKPSAGQDQALMVSPQDLPQDKPIRKDEGGLFIKALTSAYETNPELQIALTQQYQTAEKLANAKAGWRPSVSMTGRGGMDATVSKSSQSIGNITAGNRNRLSRENHQAGVAVTQNLYRGGQTYYGVKSAEYTVLAGEFGVHTKEQQVLQAAIKAYLETWLAERNLEARLTSEKFHRRNFEEISAQANVGEKTATEAAEAQAKLAQATADRATQEAQLEAARETFRQVIGFNAPENLPLPNDLIADAALPKTVEALVQEAEEGSPDVQNALLAEKAARHSITATEGALLPTVDFTVEGNRGWIRGSHAKGTATPFSRTNTASAHVDVKIPLYQTGAEWSNIRSTNQQQRQSLYAIAQQKRAVIATAKSAWAQFKSALVTITNLKLAVKAAELNLLGKTQEYLLGATTMTEKLQAEATLVDSKTRLNQAEFNRSLQKYQLVAATGKLIPETLKLPTNRHNTRLYTDQVKDLWFGRGPVGKAPSEPEAVSSPSLSKETRVGVVPAAPVGESQ